MGQTWMLVRAAAILLVTRQTLALSDIFEEGKSDKEILDNLLRATRYDKRLLPPVRGSLTVNVSVLLLSLASPDESSLKYEVEFLLQQQWYDPRLRYSNQSQYSYLNAIHHHDDIWLPDTYFIMHGDFKDPLIPVHFSLRIYRNGSVNYLMRRHLILSCQGSLNIFPFDDPKCTFSMESISYEITSINYVWKNDEDVLRKSPSLTTLNAYLINNQTLICPIQSSWRGNYSCLRVHLIFTRDRAFYFTTVFIPGIILVTSSFITFWLEWNAVPARVMIGVTTMLNFFTTSNGFRSTLPVVSNLTAMNVWDGVCMCFIYASLLEFVCVNYVGRKRPLHNVVYRPGENPFTQGDKKRDSVTLANEIISCANCGPNPCSHTNNGCPAEARLLQVRKKEPPHPIRVAKTIDVIARITFPTAFATSVWKTGLHCDLTAKSAGRLISTCQSLQKGLNVLSEKSHELGDFADQIQHMRYQFEAARFFVVNRSVVFYQINKTIQWLIAILLGMVQVSPPTQTYQYKGNNFVTNSSSFLLVSSNKK